MGVSCDTIRIRRDMTSDCAQEMVGGRFRYVVDRIDGGLTPRKLYYSWLCGRAWGGDNFLERSAVFSESAMRKVAEDSEVSKPSISSVTGYSYVHTIQRNVSLAKWVNARPVSVRIIYNTCWFSRIETLFQEQPSFTYDQLYVRICLSLWFTL